MDIINTVNLLLDGSGILILLLFLLPAFLGSSKALNRRKRNLLLYAALVHLFALCVRLVGTVSRVSLPNAAAAEIFSVAAAVLIPASAVLLALCILCEEDGRIRIPKGRAIPVGQIACAVLPSAAALCLRLVFPTVGCFGLAWAVSLHLIHALIQLDSEKKLMEAEQRLNREQAMLMTVQMQPHFIFNTLSAIEGLCQTDAQAAAESIENLSGYLRANIDALTAQTLIPFDEELRHIRQYVALEQTDPARQFHFEYELEVRDFAIPPLSVQPIVENAVKHGALTHRDGKGRVTLSTEAFGSYLRITVTDNGLASGGLTDAQRERRGVGIENTRQRLSALCGGSLEYTTGENGTKAVILIPRKGG